jgi:RNA polymerase sigma-70 factor (ECF subfamily)
MIEKELSEILRDKIAHLPRKMRQVFSLSRDEQLSHQEISERLNISTKTVRQQIYNALLNLKSNLKYVFLFFFS